MKLTVNVTAEDIAEGQYLDCERCPIALAVSRAIGRQALVADGAVSVGGYEDEEILPRRVQAFIVAFDADLTCIPISFDIDVPDEWVKAEAHHAG